MTNFKCPSAPCAYAFKEKLKATWPLTSRRYPIICRSLSIDSGRRALYGCCSSGRSHDRNVTSLFTKSRGWQRAYRSTIVAWIFARALLYRAYACFSLVEGVAYHEQVAFLLESLGGKARIGPGEPIAAA
jgi:hypothetical protein